MLDGVSLDQLRTFIAAADEGSFSALDFLRAGFGFGFMPLHVVEADLASGALVQIAAEEAPPEGHAILMSAIYRTDSPPGPAGRWIIDHLKQAGAQRLEQQTSVSAAASAPSFLRADWTASIGNHGRRASAVA